MDSKWQKDRRSELPFSQGNCEYLSLKNICNIIKGSSGEARVHWERGRDPLDSPPQAGFHPFMV